MVLTQSNSRLFASFIQKIGVTHKVVFIEGLVQIEKLFCSFIPD